ncbi:aconitate hydratase AcnA [Glutamicibacter sp. JL.03c]|uniref:aconitate hydratase AcnA n=1 Tax=Glutamicibacter sp. JL.03c TaxID=2984842 RepID=UPI0021F6A7AE|nr:aconitate hydratase AcnA [Glutamicibacter sp. JL.03c]UYQ77797.1 aconitate hydratase AcnA [Glutamicibacter sp. JL.03c]
MPSQSQPCITTFDSGGHRYSATDLRAALGPEFSQLPVVLRLLAENTLRRSSAGESARTVANLKGWLREHRSEAELEYWPHRILMHDTTSTPALVDIAAMRDSLAEAGIDPSVLNPQLQVEVSIDHSLAVEDYGRDDAAPRNLAHEYRRNRERYKFLKWAQQSMETVNVNPPGTGIMHTLNLEQLATVAHLDIERSENLEHPLVVPDMMIGTDSHTPMVNALGVLGWGVGGLEAQTVMFGLPTTLRIPDVIGFRLTGQLPAGATATDLALNITHIIRERGASGEFVEFFGPGVSTLTAGERAVVANMAPEYGASTGYFPVDQQVLDYLAQTGRTSEQIQLVQDYYQAAGLWFDPQGQPEYTDVLELDLGQVRLSAAGPRRPQDLMDVSHIPQALEGEANGVEEDAGGLPRFAIALAAITSCTNTTDPKLLIAAGLVARKAREYGLKVPHWVKTSLAPGSPAAMSYLRRAGLLEDLGYAGFDVVGFGCTTCIGNSGPLSEPISQELAESAIRPVAVLSGNRNFAGRIHPDLDLGFLVSPPLVVAFALVGRADVDLLTYEFTPEQAGGTPVKLADLLPTREEVQAAWELGHDAEDFARDFKFATTSPLWSKLDAPTGARFQWNEDSNILRRPPFAAANEGSQLGTFVAHPLLVLGDDVTTDHISPASAIPADSLVADYLVSRGENRNDLNVFASRRGNFEVMVRGGFHAKNLENKLGANLPVAHTVHAGTGEVIPLTEAAKRYREQGHSTVVIAGERYGTGSSRDWAAKVQRLLGVHAVLAGSFERIHRSNLIGMGVVPLLVPQEVKAQLQQLVADDRIEISAPSTTLAVRGAVPVKVEFHGGGVLEFEARLAAETELDLALLKAGGVIPHLLAKTQAQFQEVAR